MFERYHCRMQCPPRIELAGQLYLDICVLWGSSYKSSVRFCPDRYLLDTHSTCPSLHSCFCCLNKFQEDMARATHWSRLGIGTPLGNILKKVAQSLVGSSPSLKDSTPFALSTCLYFVLFLARMELVLPLDQGNGALRGSICRQTVPVRPDTHLFRKECIHRDRGIPLMTAGMYPLGRESGLWHPEGNSYQHDSKCSWLPLSSFGNNLFYMFPVLLFGLREIFQSLQAITNKNVKFYNLSTQYPP